MANKSMVLLAKHISRFEEKGTIHGKVKTRKKGFEFDSDSECRAWHCVRCGRGTESRGKRCEQIMKTHQ